MRPPERPLIRAKGRSDLGVTGCQIDQSTGACKVMETAILSLVDRFGPIRCLAVRVKKRGEKNSATEFIVT